MIDFRNMDCMELMAEFEDNHFGLAIVDPPYGIGFGGGCGITGLKSRPNWEGTTYTKKEWDNEIPSKEYFEELKRVSKNQIIWGGNYFTEHLEPTNSWIFWDKKMSHNKNFSHGEMAWTSCKGQLKMFSYSGTGYSKDKIHPTEKPVKLYTWLLANYAKKGDKILDTHVGSASSLIACHQLGFDVTGCELDEEYYKNAQERIKQETAQLSLF